MDRSINGSHSTDPNELQKLPLPSDDSADSRVEFSFSRAHRNHAITTADTAKQNLENVWQTPSDAP
jgi:hypothetical protein